MFQTAFRLAQLMRNNKYVQSLTTFSGETEARISKPNLPGPSLKSIFALFIAGGQTHIDKFHHQIFFRPEKGFHFFQRIDFPNHRRQSCVNDGRDFAIGCFVVHGGFEVLFLRIPLVAKLFPDAVADFELFHVFRP